MKSLFLKSLTGVCLLSLSCLASAGPWVNISGTNWEYAPSSAVMKSSSVVLVMVKFKLSKKDVAQVRKDGLGSMVKDYAYTVSQNEIDCEHNTVGLASIMYINKSGSVISKPYLKTPEANLMEVQAIEPSTPAAELAKRVCTFRNQTS